MPVNCNIHSTPCGTIKLWNELEYWIKVEKHEHVWKPRLVTHIDWVYDRMKLIVEQMNLMSIVARHAPRGAILGLGVHVPPLNQWTICILR